MQNFLLSQKRVTALRKYANLKLKINAPTFHTIFVHNQGYFSADFKSLSLPSLFIENAFVKQDLTCLGIWPLGMQEGDQGKWLTLPVYHVNTSMCL